MPACSPSTQETEDGELESSLGYGRDQECVYVSMCIDRERERACTFRMLEVQLRDSSLA